MDKLSKVAIGGGGICFLLTLILGPLLLFSTYNPLASVNVIDGASVSVGLQLGNNYYTLYQNNYVSSLTNLSQAEFEDIKFKRQPAIRDVDRDQVMCVKMSQFSEQTWNINYKNYKILQESIVNVTKAIEGTIKAKETDTNKTNPTAPKPAGTIKSLLELSAESDKRFYIQMNIQFSQSQVKNVAPATFVLRYDLYKRKEANAKGLQMKLDTLSKAIVCDEKAVFEIDDLYDSLMRIGPQVPLTPVSINEDFLRKAKIRLICDDEFSKNAKFDSSKVVNSFWEITTDTDKEKNGLVFYIISNKQSSFLVSFSIQAFYVGIVLLIGNSVRVALSGQIHMISLTEMPLVDNLLQICEGILIARAEKNLIKEERFYWELIDIMRSPEAMKLMSGSAVQEKKIKSKYLQHKMKTD